MAAYRREGATALAHGNRGRRAHNQLDPKIGAEIVSLGQGEYRDYNDCHFTEELAERHQIVVSCATVRWLRRRAGLASPRKRRAPRHRRRRQRYPQRGMLLQVDGSKHDWLEERGPWLTLHATVAYQGRVLGMFQPAQFGPPRLEEFEAAAYHLFEEVKPTPPAQPLAVPVATNGATNKTPRVYPKPPANHPWRRDWKAK